MLRPWTPAIETTLPLSCPVRASRFRTRLVFRVHGILGFRETQPWSVRSMVRSSYLFPENIAHIKRPGLAYLDSGRARLPAASMSVIAASEPDRIASSRARRGSEPYMPFAIVKHTSPTSRGRRPACKVSSRMPSSLLCPFKSPKTKKLVLFPPQRCQNICPASRGTATSGW